MGWLQSAEEEELQTEPQERSSISHFDNRTYGLQQGLLLRRVRARLATELGDTGILDLEKPQVSGTSNENFDWLISADHGKLYPDEKGLELSGQVFLQRTGGDESGASVRGDYLQWRDDGSDVLWQGNVEVFESDIHLSGDEFRVWERNEQERGFEMRGSPAKFTRSGVEEARGEADILHYDGFRHYMQMLGNAKLDQDGITVRGPRLEYYPSSGGGEDLPAVDR